MPNEEKDAGGSEETLGDKSLPDLTRIGELTKQLAKLQVVKEETLRQLQLEVHDGRTDPLLNELERTGCLTPFQRHQIKEGEISSLRFDDYVILDRLGGGGMGEVFKAKNVELERTEAIKMIRPVDAANDRVLHRLKREAIALAQMEHPSIVPVYKVGRVDSFGYIAMKFVDGEDLQKKVMRLRDQGEFLDVATACRWIRDAADALHHAHQRGVVHRDVKPSNLMIDTNDNLVLLDLGIARLVDPEMSGGEALTKARHALGTPQYMPPEQWADAHEVTAASDVYSLGCTLYFALAGSAPFPCVSSIELMRAHTFKDIPPVADLRLDVPDQLDRIIARATAKDPAERFKTAHEFALALEPFTHAPSFSNAVVAVQRPAASNRRASSAWALSGAALLVLATLGGGYWWWQAIEPVQTAAVTASETPSDDKPAAQEDLAATPAEPPPVDVEAAPAEQVELVPETPVWLVAYQKKYADVWPDLDELVELAGSLAGGELSVSLVEPGGKLAEQTQLRQRKRLQADAESWLKAFSEEHPLLWPEDDLREFANSITLLENLESAPQWNVVQEAVQAETTNLLDPLQPMRDEVVTNTWAATALPALRELLAMQSSPPDSQWRLQAEFVDKDGRPIERMTVDSTAFLKVASNKSADLTIVRFDEFEFVVFPIPERIRGGSERTLTKPEFIFNSSGVKRFFVYATDEPICDEIVFPLHNEQPLIAQWFKSPRVFDRIERTLQQGHAYPGFPPSQRIHSWTRLSVAIEVK